MIGSKKPASGLRTQPQITALRTSFCSFYRIIGVESGDHTHKNCAGNEYKKRNSSSGRERPTERAIFQKSTLSGRIRRPTFFVVLLVTTFFSVYCWLVTRKTKENHF